MPTKENILQGVSRLFIGTANSDVIPADTVALGGTWPGTWRDMGYTTEDGVTINWGQTFNPVMTAQDQNPVTYLPGQADDRISATLYEATLTNIRAATGRGTITTSPANGGPGFEQLVLAPATTVRFVAIGFEGQAPPMTKSNPRRVLFPSALAVATVAMNQRVTAPYGIPVEFGRVGGTGNDVIIRDVLTV